MEKDRSKLISVQMDSEGHEVSLGSREAENLYFSRDGNEGEGAVGALKRSKKHQGKGPRNLDMENFQIDDDREACSGTEEGLSVKKIKNEQDTEIRDSKPTRGSSKKRSRQLFFGGSGQTALVCLSILSLLETVILFLGWVHESEHSQNCNYVSTLYSDCCFTNAFANKVNIRLYVDMIKLI